MNKNTVDSVLQDLKDKIDSVLDDKSVIVYSSEEFMQIPQGDNRLRESNRYVAIMYAGMASNKSAIGGRSTTGRFVIIISGGLDRMRLRGLDEDTTMLPFLSKLRSVISQDRSPNNQPYSFVYEVPTPFDNLGDGYTQQWSVPLTIDS